MIEANIREVIGRIRERSADQDRWRNYGAASDLKLFADQLDAALGAVPQPPEIEISDELRATLDAALKASDALGPSTSSPNAARTYHAVPGQAAIAVRSYDQQGRRVTNFISISTSFGLNAVAMAAQIAEGLAAGGGASIRPQEQDYSERRLVLYQLPNGLLAPVDDSAVKGATEIDFTLADGQIVKAVRVPRGMYA